MKTISKSCLNCRLQFQAQLKEHRRGNANYCSISCGHKSKKRTKIKIPNVTCSYCNLAFYKSPNRLKNSRHKIYFCCRRHKDLGQRLESNITKIHPPHYTQGKYIGSNYRRVAFNHYPHVCNRCKYNKIINILCIHHIDRNRNNNEVSNLEILCPNCHFEEHFNAKDGLYSNLK